VLRHLFPAADVPVVQVALPAWEPRRLRALGEALAPLRGEGILLLASGGLVHNLRAVDWAAPEGAAEPWALEAEAWFLDRLFSGEEASLLDHRDHWPGSRLAAPTTEHLDPLFVALGASGGEAPRTVFQGWQLATMSLRALAWG
jgi:4,5-DOPA dioxygenase extradiol